MTEISGRCVLMTCALFALLACGESDDASEPVAADARVEAPADASQPGTPTELGSVDAQSNQDVDAGGVAAEAGAPDAQVASGADGGRAPGTGPAEPCQDTCPVAAGVALACKLRFMYGLNYAWHYFGGDFGGIRAWNQRGVSGEPTVATELAAMAAGGVNVLRWWLFPDFRGDGVSFDAADTPTGLGGTVREDLARALELADQHDLYLMLTLFSFDNFRATRTESNLRIRGIKPIVIDSAKRGALMEKVVAPVARAVTESPHAERLLAWDIINEPEWAISGASLYGGDPAFDPQTNLESVSHREMETFLRDTLETLRAHSRAPISVGATAIKWKSAWSQLALDFHQFHTYDWVNMYWPYDRAPSSYGLDDKPLVMGEFPLTGLTGANYATLLESWFENHYGGALAWAYTDSKFSGARDLSQVKAFASEHPCETRY